MKFLNLQGSTQIFLAIWFQLCAAAEEEDITTHNVGNLPICAQACLASSFIRCSCQMLDFECGCKCSDFSLHFRSCSLTACSASFQSPIDDLLSLACPLPSGEAVSSSSSSSSSDSTTSSSTDSSTTTNPDPHKVTPFSNPTGYGNSSSDGDAKGRYSMAPNSSWYYCYGPTGSGSGSGSGSAGLAKATCTPAYETVDVSEAVGMRLTKWVVTLLLAVLVIGCLAPLMI